MDDESSQPGTPVGRPLQTITANAQQRDSLSSVHDKISQFNNMSIAMQSKQLERRTADAALKRAMIGREEAEVELRKCKEELKALRKIVDEGKERERRVGERLETVMVRYHLCVHIAAPYPNPKHRKTMAERKRHTRTHKPSGRRRSAAHGRRHSRHSLRT
jgi:hypothetical protein